MNNILPCRRWPYIFWLIAHELLQTAQVRAEDELKVEYSIYIFNFEQRKIDKRNERLKRIRSDALTSVCCQLASLCCSDSYLKFGGEQTKRIRKEEEKNTDGFEVEYDSGDEAKVPRLAAFRF